jgi:hypothetical protein
LDVRLVMKAVEESGFSDWIRNSPSLFAYWFFLTFHCIGMALLVGASAVIDLRILGIARDLPLAPLKGLYRVIWTGFWIQILSGALLLIAFPTKALTNPDFYIKLTLIGLAVVVMRMMKTRVFLDTGLSEPAMMVKGRTYAILSLIFWVGAVTAGRLLAYTYTAINYSG